MFRAALHRALSPFPTGVTMRSRNLRKGTTCWRPGPARLGRQLVTVSAAMLLGACSEDLVSPAPAGDMKPPSQRSHSLIPGSSPALTSSIPLAVGFSQARLPLDRAYDVN